MNKSHKKIKNKKHSEKKNRQEIKKTQKMKKQKFSFKSVYDGNSSGGSESDGDYFSSDDEYHHFKKNGFLVSVFSAVGAITTKRMKIEREQRHVRDRMEWQSHVSELMKEGPNAFQKMYRMSLGSFNKLCNLLRPFLEVHQEMAYVRSDKGPIIPEVCLHCTLRWLAGGSFYDARISAGISVPSFYRVVFKCIDAINQCPELKYHLPTDLDEAAQNFQDISSNSVISGCVGALDGYLLEIKAPS